MSSANVANGLGVVRVPFYTPIPKALKIVEREFDRGARVVQVRGFPLKIFCVREPEDNVALLRDKEVGEIKLPALLPRVKQVMRGGGYIQPGGPVWRERRRQVQDGFRSEQLKHYVAQIPALVERTTAAWPAHGSPAMLVDVSAAMRELITAVNLKIFFSFEPPASQLADIAHWTHFIEHRLVGVVPLWVPTPANVKFNTYARKLRSTFAAMVERRAGLPDAQQPKDLLSVLLKARHTATDTAWTTDDIVDEAFSVFFGASVVAISIAWGLHRLGLEPTLQQALRQEVVSYLAQNDDEATTLPACPACDILTKETLRMYPASWGYPRHCRSGMQIAGITVPAGAIVIPMVQLAHARPTTWEEPTQFCPHRFDTTAGGAAMASHAYLPFGMGSRTCLGANLAPMMIKTVLGMLLQRFELSCPPSQSQPVGIDYGFEMQPAQSILLQVKRVAV